MATLTKFQIFVEDLAEAVHNLATNNLRLALFNTVPSASADAVLADVGTEIAYTFLATNPTSRDITVVSSSQTGGVYSLVASDQTLSASGGSVGPFQYIVVYNEATVAKVDPLIGWYDYGSALTLNDGESLTIDYGANGAGNGNILTIT